MFLHDRNTEGYFTLWPSRAEYERAIEKIEKLQNESEEEEIFIFASSFSVDPFLAEEALVSFSS